MKNFVVSLLLTLLVATPGLAQKDRVKTTSGVVTGQVTASSPVSVTVTRGSTEKKVAVVDITAVQFEGEPSELRQARLNFANGGYRVAVDNLNKIDTQEIDNPYITEDIAFYQAACAARLALLGEGTINDAGRSLNRFLEQSRRSFHWLEGTELMGDLLVAAGRHELASKRYSQLAKAPWPAYKIRAGVLLGEVSQAKGAHDEAIRQFDTALAIDSTSGGADNSPAVAQQRLRARLGRAVSLAATGKLDEGVGLVQEVIKESDPEARRLNAMAYNALGGCYRQAGQTKEATFAYLHVDLLYASSPSQHAEALYYLGGLLEEIRKPDQARDARQRLKRLYASSKWAQK